MKFDENYHIDIEDEGPTVRDIRTTIAGSLSPWIKSWSARLAAADVLLSLPNVAIVDPTVGPLDEYRGQ